MGVDLDQANDSQAVPDPSRWWDMTDKHAVARRYRLKQGVTGRPIEGERLGGTW